MGHRASECQSHRKCRRCGRKHHQSLCEQDSTPQLPPVSDGSKDTNPITTSTVAKTKNNVLLQTARFRAYAVDNRLVPVRVLLDSGSQHSYVHY